MAGATIACHEARWSYLQREGALYNVLNTKVAKTVSLNKVVYWTTFYWSSWHRLCFPPFSRQQLQLLRRKQVLYDYHFFQMKSFLVSFFANIKYLWYDSSSFIQAKIFRSQGNPSHYFSWDNQAWCQFFFIAGNFLSTLLSSSLDGTTVLSTILSELVSDDNLLT